MIRHIYRVLSVASFLFFAVLAIFAIPSFLPPAFEVVNESTEPVFVVAEWRNEEKEIGNINPMSSYEFRISDEAAMKFSVTYPGGGKAESEQIYFTRGVKVIATITDKDIKVRYDSET